ncbi:Transcriptional regulator TetR family [Patulibacter medicamentivorans]|uniref:Transcriptional regulator TetR family n=1 Tax=Patulibacter medicamentivorans TaxID=1097667 RepID=H0EAJ0_9ACTN|nr:Transcriptional regulator TetR family [Patulibacter medicamentivorans]
MVAPTATERHLELLDDLVELFLAEGFASFTLGDLATRLRCSKTTLYALGRNKEQLTAGAVRHFFRTATAFVEERTAAQDDPAERIVVYLRAVADALRPASAQFMADLADHPAAAEVYERNTAAAAERVRRLIAEGVDAGDFRAVHAAFVADTVAATMTRIQSGAVLRNTGLHDAEAYEELAALVLGGVRR